MIRVGKHKRGAQFLDLDRGERLDCCLRANRREDRREEVTMRGSEDPRAGTVVAGCDGEFEHGANYTVGATRILTTDATSYKDSFLTMVIDGIIGSPLQNGEHTFILAKTSRAQNSPNS